MHFVCFKLCFFPSFIITFSPSSVCHSVTQQNMAVQATHTSFTSSLSPPPGPSRVTYSYSTNHSFVLHRCVYPNYKKVSTTYNIIMLTILLQKEDSILRRGGEPGVHGN